MADIEKVTKGLYQHCEGSMFDRCGDCPYYEHADAPFICRDMLLSDLNELLKEKNLRIWDLLCKIEEQDDDMRRMRLIIDEYEKNFS